MISQGGKIFMKWENGRNERSAAAIRADRFQVTRFRDFSINKKFFPRLVESGLVGVFISRHPPNLFNMNPNQIIQADLLDIIFEGRNKGYGAEKDASYKGGPKAWERFLRQKCNTPQEALEKGIRGTVIVQFMVDEQGIVSDVQAISGPEELKGEGVRVIKKSGQWEPALQNGRHVRSYKKQPLVFTVIGQED
jgi:Gram-negative bacterial TonB protein C-terminal